MCFSTPDPVQPPSPPSADAEAARARIAAEQQAASQAQGRQATILTSPLGVPGSVRQQNRQRTTIGGTR